MWDAKPGLEPAQALRYWRNEHAALVRQVPGLRRYVQNHCVDDPEGGGPPYTGLGEVWFDSVEDAQTAASTPEWAAVLDDAATFMAMDRVVAAWAEEHSLV
ncbi:MAG: EthD family reductase [Nitriliruptorales bacterium]|nr:EthD family reductase [Nitriliruptorales bacterium]